MLGLWRRPEDQVAGRQTEIYKTSSCIGRNHDCIGIFILIKRVLGVAWIIPLLGGVSGSFGEIFRGQGQPRRKLILYRISEYFTNYRLTHHPKSPPKRGLSNLRGEIVMSVNGKYIYGFTRSDATLSSAINGISGKPIFAISDNGVAAVVSDGPDGKLRPERKNLSAHHGVIKEIMKTLTILPVSFGVVADNEASIKKILKLKS